MMVRRNMKSRAVKAAPVASHDKPTEEVKVSVEDMSWPELKSLASQKGISVYGKKAAEIKEELKELGL